MALMNFKKMEVIKFYNDNFHDKDALTILKQLSSDTAKRTVFSTSLSYEDQILTHLIFENKLNIDVFTIDTGRLFPETYNVLNETLKKYNQPIKVYHPQAIALENLVSEKGPYSFYENTDNRKECCYIRKVEPLKRALKGYDIWVTGIRSAHSHNRKDLQMVEWDPANQLTKVHPILNWTNEDVKQFIKFNNVPSNKLHEKGFVSIGCQPCTRAIKEGEDFRAGRWWWEDTNKKECGLHFNN